MDARLFVAWALRRLAHNCVTVNAIPIRRAFVADVEMLAPLFDAYRQFYGSPSDVPAAKQFLEQRLYREESVVLQAHGEGVCKGFVQLYPSFSSGALARTFVLNDLYVDERFRRQGIATQLLAAAEQFARAEGAARLTLATGVGNVGAQAVYESSGWIRDSKFVVYHLPLLL